MTETGADEEESATKSKTKLKKQIHSMMAVLKVFRNWHYGSWIFVVFIMGASNGLIWGFLFWHLDNLGEWLGFQQARDVDPMLVKCRASVADGGPTLNQNWHLANIAWAGALVPCLKPPAWKIGDRGFEPHTGF